MSKQSILTLLLLCASCATKSEDLGNSGAALNAGATNGTAPASRPTACLLEYNESISGSAEDSCCYNVGFENECDPHQWCDDPTGASCCVLYATAWTSLGAGPVCCAYADGTTPTSDSGADISAECGALLANSPPADTCLLSYGATPSGAADCCYSAGGANRCDLGHAPQADGCILHATAAAPTGAACCLYADGHAPHTAAGRDISVACQGLLLANPEPTKDCRLEYNPLLDAAHRGCCASTGASSQCDTHAECSASAGENCCLIRATDRAPTGPGCCLYADGSPPRAANGADITLACNAMLTGVP
jgi:hypothetical protein